MGIDLGAANTTKETPRASLAPHLLGNERQKRRLEPLFAHVIEVHGDRAVKLRYDRALAKFLVAHAYGRGLRSGLRVEFNVQGRRAGELLGLALLEHPLDLRTQRLGAVELVAELVVQKADSVSAAMLVDSDIIAVRIVVDRDEERRLNLRSAVPPEVGRVLHRLRPG